MHSNVNEMLIKKLYNCKIINKTTEGAFTYYIITEGRGSLKCLCMIMGAGWGGSWLCDDIS